MGVSQLLEAHVRTAPKVYVCVPVCMFLLVILCVLCLDLRPLPSPLSFFSSFLTGLFIEPSLKYVNASGGDECIHTSDNVQK